MSEKKSVNKIAKGEREKGKVMMVMVNPEVRSKSVK